LDERDYTTEISEDGEVLRIVVHGAMEFARTSRFVTLVRDAAKARGRRRVLIDARAFKQAMPNKDRFAMGELIGEEWRGLRVAIVNPIAAENGFVETVAVNRGADTRTLATVPEALDWLQRS
jgi:hypothetical protein